MGNRWVLPAPQEGPPLGLQRLDMGGEKADLLPRTLETGPQGGWQWRTIPLLRLIELAVHIALECELHPMAGSQAFDAIDDPGAILFGCQHLAVELPTIFLLDARHAHHTPHLRLACEVAQ